MVQEPRTYNEKRNFIRMRIDTPVEVTFEGGRFTAQCRDLSGSGMLLASAQELPLETEISVTIAQEGENLSPFKATGRIVRIDSADQGFILGVSLTSIDD
jgi:hypothetical protein